MDVRVMKEECDTCAARKEKGGGMEGKKRQETNWQGKKGKEDRL